MAAGQFWPILQALRLSLQGLACVQAQGITVPLRKRLAVLEADGKSTLLILAPGREGERKALQLLGGNTLWDYPAVAALVRPAGAEVALDRAWLDLRETVRDRLYRPVLQGVSVFDVRLDPDEALDMAAALGAGWDVTGWGVWYRQAKARVT